MRKLLILIVVLGMASMANATLQISVNGDPNPVDTEIVLPGPSSMLTLDVHTDAALDYLGTYLMFAVDVADGTVAGGNPTIGGLSKNLNAYVTYFQYYAGLAATPAGNPLLSGVAGSVSDADSTFVFPIGLIYDNIEFHCESENYDTIVSLYSSPDSVVWSLDDQVTIHQIPEPITMALLGLGGLLLRRRK